MSASQEKKRRRDEREDGTEKRLVAQKNTVKQKKRNKLITTIVAIAVVILLVAVIVINSSLFYRYLPAVSIGDESYTTAEFNYFYFSGYYNFAQQYESYISAGYINLDTTKPLTSQTYSEDQTWGDYFKDSALQTMQQVTALCADAKANGFTISEDYQSALDSSLSSLKTEATSNGYDVDAYCEQAYGKGSSYDIVEEMMTNYYYANSYGEYTHAGFEYTGDELESYYQEKKDTFDYLDYRYYYADGSADDEAGITAETAMANAKAAVTAIVDGASDDKTFTDLVQENCAEDEKETYAEEDATLYHTQGQSLSATYSAWLLDASREYGDTEIFESSSGYYAVMYVGRDDNHYNVAQVRHILIKAVDADEDSAYSETEKADAKAKAEEIYKQWQDGDATEDSFAALATEYSEDTGSNTNGGLYDTIYQGQTVAEFDAFCFDEGRKPGDTAIVYGEVSGSYVGYHIMYYVGEGGLYSDTLADSSKRSEDYSAWQTALMEKCVPVEKFAIRFAR